MKIGWIDFSREDRKKVLSAIELLSEPGTLDELGIAPIRDGFSDVFFPGTSTIQTRAKYFLIVPYAIDTLVRTSNSSPEEILEKMDQVERECASILNQPGVSGVIGTNAMRSGGWVQRTPAIIYWAGLRRYEIFRGVPMSLAEYLRIAVALKKSKKDLQKMGSRNDDLPELDGDDGDAGSLYSKSFWNLPEYDLKEWKNDLTMDLSRKEAEFLKEQIIETQPKSLLALILQMNLKESISLENFQEFETLIHLFPIDVQKNYYLSQSFSNFIYLARIRYNIILSEGNNQNAVKQWNLYEKELDRYANVDLESIFQTLKIRNVQLRRFLNSLQECFRLSDINKADHLIIQREINLKGSKRAKLNSPGSYPVDKWLGGELLEYRFKNAMIIVKDIFDGLEVK